MNLTKICLGGFTNIETVEVDLKEMNALIAPNGYGKSNVMKAINFGTEFIGAAPAERERMMHGEAYLPINVHCYEKPFRYEIEGSMELQGEHILFSYGYEFDWQKSQIIREWLKMKCVGEQRFRQLILREDPIKLTYLPSTGQRCTKPMEAEGNILAIAQKETFSRLFYGELTDAISSMQIPRLESLENPDNYFSTDRNACIDFLGGKTINEYIYQLMVDRPDDYALLKDGIMSLNRNLESFTPIEAKLGEGMDSTLYDIRIKDRNSVHETSISRLSAGSKRIIFLFTIAMTANMRGLPLLLLEEPENSVHPRLMENLLLLLKSYAEDTKILLSSHSPYLMRYMSVRNLWYGLPNNEGLARFAQLKEKKLRYVLKCASEMELTLGEYMFDFMLDIEDSPERIEEFFEVKGV